MMPRLPGTVGSPLAASMRRTAYLLLKRSSTSARGPMKARSCAAQTSAKPASSERKP